MGKANKKQLKRLTREILAAWDAGQTKVNPAYAGIMTFSDTPQPVTMPKNYLSYAKEGYRQNDTVYKCISYIARNGAAIPPKLYTDESRDKEIESHPLLDKLNHPNSEQSGVSYREAVIGFLLLAGNSYQYAIRTAKNGPPDELWTLSPNDVSILPTKTRGIVSYKYEPFGNDHLIDAPNIGHAKYWHPDNELYGLSPIEVVALSIDQQVAAKKWNLALLQNSARPPGAWTTTTQLSFNERQTLEKQLQEKLSGYRNAGKPPVLDGGLKWESMGLPPAQMEFLDLLKYNGGSIANIYNMPPQLVGDTSSTTYDNYEQAKAASYTEAIFPDLDKLYALWNNWLLPMYPDLKKAYLYYDKESVEVIAKIIQAMKDAQAKRANSLWMSGQCTLNEAREITGLPSVPGGDVFRYGAVLVRASELDEYAEQSLAEPAAPPMPVPEPLPPPTIIDADPTKPPAQLPAPKPKPAQTSDVPEPEKQPAKALDDLEERRRAREEYRQFMRSLA